MDFEASGFGRDSYPIEVGFVTEDGRAWCSLIKPEENWQHWDASAEGVHQITRDLLHQHGRPAREVASYLNDKLLNMVVYTDGWAHDYIWMSKLFDQAEMSPHFRLEDLRNVLSHDQQAQWHAIKDEVVATMANKRHRASIDARVLQLTWIKTAGLA